MPLPTGHSPFSSFSSLRGARAAKHLFYWLECRFVIFAIFVKNPLFLAGQKHGLPKTPFSGPRKIGVSIASDSRESVRANRVANHPCHDSVCASVQLQETGLVTCAGSGFGSWRTLPTVPVLLVPGTAVPTVSGAGLVPALTLQSLLFQFPCFFFFFCFFRFSDFAFWGVFSFLFFSKDFRGSAKRKALFWVFRFP